MHYLIILIPHQTLMGFDASNALNHRQRQPMFYHALSALDQRCLPTLLLPNQPIVVSCVALNHIAVKTDTEK
mgnify:CR=1 FL=1